MKNKKGDLNEKPANNHRIATLFKKKSKGIKHALPEIYHSIISCGVTALFVLFVMVIVDISGGTVFKGKHAFFYFLFVLACSVLAGTLTQIARMKRRKESSQKISSAVEKLCNGDYDISLGELEGSFDEVGRAIEKIAKGMQEAETAKDDFINDFSHELKTPIVSIRGFARLLQKDGLSEEDKQEYTSIIVSESDRLIDLTASTLMLNRLQNGEYQLEQKTFNLSELLRKCILILQNEWESKNVSIFAEFEEVYIDGNEELLNQLFINVIQNAIKFTHENGNVTITIADNSKEVSVSVVDDGIGMDEETKRRMFDKYFRGEKSRTTHGNGLGLSTVKRIAEIFNLKINVKSAKDVGTVFTIVFKK